MAPAAAASATKPSKAVQRGRQRLKTKASQIKTSLNSDDDDDSTDHSKNDGNPSPGSAPEVAQQKESGTSVLGSAQPQTRNAAAASRAEDEPKDTQRQRPALKIRICTWNMAESIPSGDLSVLLGKVPPFVSPSGWDVHDSEVAEAAVKEEEPQNGEQEGNLQSSKQAVVEGIQAGKAALFPTSDQKHKPEHERIPPLPLDDQHPFHIFVVAAQECPFGDAGRLATGVGMAGELGGLGRTKSKAHRDKDHPKHHKSKSSKHHNKDAESRPDGPTRLDTEKSDVSAPPSTTGSPKTPFGPAAGEYFPSSTVHNNNSVEAIAPLPPSSYEMPKADRSTVRGFSGKPGWSDLCENWLCSSRAAGSGSGGGAAAKWPSGANKAASIADGRRDPTAAAVTPAVPHHLLDISKSASTSQLGSQSSIETPQTPSTVRVVPDGSADLTPRAEDQKLVSDAIPSAQSTPGDEFKSRPSTPKKLVKSRAPEKERTPNSPRKKLQGLHLQIPATVSKKTLLSPLSASASTPTAKSAGFSGMARLQSNSSTSSSQTPSSSAGGGAHGSFTPANDQTPASLGPYELVAKERMMGVYLAVYCWKGCRDRVQGSSKAYVKSGLLGARVGNKGAIGISVKMGGARLLFVNAHLAAHEGKVATRLQNIARIKEKLDCDTFLPSNDPRNMSEDVTERFDHVFWFGDLNFRIDITRQHADWLLMKKQYDQALEFDQLRKVMKDGSSNAFEGFQEAPITFPPTYKFDILSTLKKVKRSKTITKRILHRRTDSKEKSPALEVFESPTTETPAFAGGAALRASHSTSDAHAAAHGARALLPESSGTPAHGLGFDDDASSIGSSWGSIGSNFPYAFETESEGHLPIATEVITPSCADGPPLLSSQAEDPQSKVEDGDGAAVEGQQERASAKSKALVRKVKSLFSPAAADSPSKAATPELQGHQTSISTSSTTAAPSHPPESSQAPEASTMAGGEPVIKVLVEPKQMGKIKSLLAAAPEKAGKRHAVPASANIPSSTAATAEGRTSSGSDSDSRPVGQAKESQEEHTSSKPTTGDAANGGPPDSSSRINNESVKQVYDTSAKQRVPSWCDRVLWRSTVPIEEEEDESDDDDGDAAAADEAAVREGLAGRVGQALAQVFGGSPFIGVGGSSAFARNRVRSASSSTFAAPAGHNVEGGGATDGGGGSGRRRVPSAATMASASDVPSTSGRKRRSPIRRLLGGRSTTEAHAGTGHLLARAPSDGSRPGVRPSVGVGAGSVGGRHRSVSVVDLRPGQQRLGATAEKGLSTAPTSAPPLPPEPSSRRGNPMYASNSVGGLGRPPHAAESSGGGVPSSPRRPSWWETHIAPRLLPSFLGPPSSSSNTTVDTDPSSSAAVLAAARTKKKRRKVKLTGPRRGEVQCLVYRSLGDREMVQLKARSDHRAVIWVGAVGI